MYKINVDHQNIQLYFTVLSFMYAQALKYTCKTHQSFSLKSSGMLKSVICALHSEMYL